MRHGCVVISPVKCCLYLVCDGRQEGVYSVVGIIAVCRQAISEGKTLLCVDLVGFLVCGIMHAYSYVKGRTFPCCAFVTRRRLTRSLERCVSLGSVGVPLRL